MQILIFRLSKRSNNNAPVFTSPTLLVSAATANEPYGDTIAGSATDADGDLLTYSKVSENDAVWLTIAPNGGLSGTPNEGDIGSEDVAVMVSDGHGASAMASMEIVVLNGEGVIELLNDDMENFDSTVWTTDWRTTSKVFHSASTAVFGHGGSNDLVSPQLDTSGKTSLTISFWYYNMGIDHDDDVRIQLWNGSHYVNLEELGDGVELMWQKFSHTLTRAQNPEYFNSNFKFQIEATSIDKGEFLAIDDVSVTVK